MYALSLYSYQLDDILSFGHYLKLSLAESSVLLALIWSTFSTFFFSLFPFLTYPDELLLEVVPCYLHIGLTFTMNFLWCSILLYIHHRTQIAVDARKCGVWERVSSSGHSNSHSSDQQQQQKCPNWKQGHKYSQNAVVTSSAKVYKLLSLSSSYPFPPLEGLLAYRQVYFPVLAAETGPLHKSRVLSYLFMAVLGNIVALLLAMLVLPSQVCNYCNFAATAVACQYVVTYLNLSLPLHRTTSAACCLPPQTHSSCTQLGGTTT